MHDTFDGIYYDVLLIDNINTKEEAIAYMADYLQKKVMSIQNMLLPLLKENIHTQPGSQQSQSVWLWHILSQKMY